MRCHPKPPEAGKETNLSNAWNTRHEPDYLSHAACFRKSNGALSSSRATTRIRL
jgi:hypothetical protein